MKEEFSTRMEACDERQREFERKQAKMKDQVRPVLLLRLARPAALPTPL
jgi:hypothetical protein